MTGLTGQVRADARAGRLELASATPRSTGRRCSAACSTRPSCAASSCGAPARTPCASSATTCSSSTPAASLRSNLELTLPMDGSSPVLDLRTEVSEFDIAAVPQYLPARKMPPTVVAWLDSALRGGRATSADVTFIGPVRAFPFDGGEGEFHATRRRRGRRSSRSSETGRSPRISTARWSSRTRNSRRAAAAACSAIGRPTCAWASATCAPATSRSKRTRSAGSIKCSRS